MNHYTEENKSPTENVDESYSNADLDELVLPHLANLSPKKSSHRRLEEIVYLPDESALHETSLPSLSLDTCFSLNTMEDSCQSNKQMNSTVPRFDDVVVSPLSFDDSPVKRSRRTLSLDRKAMQALSLRHEYAQSDSEQEDPATSSSEEEATIVSPAVSKQDDSPEVMVRLETRTLWFIRIVLYLMLASVTALSVSLVFSTLEINEKETLQSMFDEIAFYLTSNLLKETQSRLVLATTLASALTQILDVSHMTPLDLSLSWSDLVSTPMRVSYASALSWSPLLLTSEELADFVASMSQRNNKKLVGNRTVADGMYRLSTTDFATPVDDHSPPPYLPISMGIGEYESMMLFNQLSDREQSESVHRMLDTMVPILSDVVGGKDGDERRVVAVFAPVALRSNVVVGCITAEFPWEQYLQGIILPPYSDLVEVVVESSCGLAKTFRLDLDSDKLLLLGEDELQQLQESRKRSATMSLASTFEDFDEMLARVIAGPSNASEQDSYCRYRFVVHSTGELEAVYITRKPATSAAIAAAVFVFTLSVVITYDCLVSRRQRKVMDTAKRSTTIVSSLFPKTVRGRLYDEAQGGSWCVGGSTLTGKTDCGTTVVHSSTKSTASVYSPTGGNKMMRRLSFTTTRSRLRSFLESQSPNVADGEAASDNLGYEGKPIADLFPETTVMFLDIAGFTAWSSERDAQQVFLLLESVWRSFDEATRRYGVFKIETIGDSYVCVTGVPDQMEDHAVAMTRFAFECLKRFNRLTKQLETQLGPSTGELQARIGLHSGPVTAGVLRGERARFQLFGDTMNTASRMESNGAPGQIHASEATAKLLVKAGRERWVTARPDLIVAKGKGQLQTYWLARRSTTGASEASFDVNDLLLIGNQSSRSSNIMLDPPMQEASRLNKTFRLVEYNVDILYTFLQKIVASRECASSRPRLTRGNSAAPLMMDDETRIILGNRGSVMDEIADTIEMPRFDPRAAKRLSESEGVELDSRAKEQLHDYVTRVSSMYRDIPYHSFEHASHTVMSVSRILGRLAHLGHEKSCGKKEHEIAREVHQTTFGISSDPLMQFALVFAALVHGVDHTGFTNAQLVQLKTPSAIMYKNKSVSEQNSLDVAWAVLMDEDFEQLRSCIYTNKQELRRFRQLVAKAVIATDLSISGADDDAGRQQSKDRQEQWDQAFDQGAPVRGRRDQRNDRKATIVFECIMQAASIAHTMQHWNTYTKWNERLFSERFLSFFVVGGAPDDHQWYRAELDFFDEHVIPLARMLNDSRVFGSSCDELLNRALQNRREWDLHGESIVKKMHSDVSASSSTMQNHQQRKSLSHY